VLGVDGISDSDALQSRKLDAEVQLHALDIMALNGDDLRPLPLSMRKTNLERLLRGRPQGIFLATIERGDIGPHCMRNGTRRICVKAPRSCLPRGPLRPLAQSENEQHSSIGRVKRSFATARGA